MPHEIYEVVAQGARYWFLFLMAVIVWRSYRWLMKDRRQRKKRLRLLPDAGFVGELVVQDGGEVFAEGTDLPVSWEGILGSHRGSDLYIPMPGIAKKHLWFWYEDGKGLALRTFFGCRANVDGVELSRWKDHYMTHGSRLFIGGVTLRLRLFLGFETTQQPMGQIRAERSVAAESVESPSTSLPMTEEELWQERQRAMEEQLWEMAEQVVARKLAEQYGVDFGEANDEASEEEAAYAGADIADEAEAGYDDSELPDDTEASYAQYAAARNIRSKEDMEASYRRPATRQVERAKTAHNLFNPFEPISEEENAEGQMVTDSAETFYPPVQDDEVAGAWPYAQYPQSSAEFEHQGYTYPEYVEAFQEDEDMTDAASHAKSLYIEPDEAERAKRLLWDRYLGGGRKG